MKVCSSCMLFSSCQISLLCKSGRSRDRCHVALGRATPNAILVHALSFGCANVSDSVIANITVIESMIFLLTDSALAKRRHCLCEKIWVKVGSIFSMLLLTFC